MIDKGIMLLTLARGRRKEEARRICLSYSEITSTVLKNAESTRLEGGGIRQLWCLGGERIAGSQRETLARETWR